ncbi:MAG: hypothetical protein ACREIW_14435, partial [Chthoniobacterales bacterium]
IDALGFVLALALWANQLGHELNSLPGLLGFFTVDVAAPVFATPSLFALDFSPLLATEGDSFLAASLYDSVR